MKENAYQFRVQHLPNGHLLSTPLRPMQTTAPGEKKLNGVQRGIAA